MSGAPAINGVAGPTAAQVLQAPPPFRKDMTKEPETRSVSPEERQMKSQTVRFAHIPRNVPLMIFSGSQCDGGESCST